MTNPAPSAIELKNLVAELMEISPSQIEDDTVLAGGRLQGSVGKAILEGGLRKNFGFSPPAIRQVNTFGELLKAMNGEQVSVSDIRQSSSSSGTRQKLEAAGTIQTGLDLEPFENFPPANDYWSEPFYTGNFAGEEIAYCQVQPEPAQHFAARWCAKEALVKCDASFADTTFCDIRLDNSRNGSPSLMVRRTASDKNNSEWERLPHSVSITHAGGFAAAVVVAGNTARPSRVSNRKSRSSRKTRTENSTLLHPRNRRETARSLMVLLPVIFLASLLFSGIVIMILFNIFD